MINENYRKNAIHWRKGGKYYYYKPKIDTGKLIVKKGIFIINFD